MAGIPLDEIEISTRARNALGAMGYKTTDDLIRAGEDELMRTPNFGRRSLDDIKLALEELGLSFGDELPPPEAPDLELLLGIRKAIDLRLDDLMLAVRLARKPAANGVDTGME